MKQLNSTSLSNLQLTYNFSDGSYGLFLIRYTGVAAAGQTVALADLGNIIFNVKGQDKINVPASILSFLDDMYAGAIETVSAIGGAFAFSIIIPCGAWFDKSNVYNIKKSDEVYFNLTFPNMVAGLIASGTITLYGKPRNGQTNYIHKILSRNVVSGGASIVTESITDNNISEVYLVNPGALISDLQLTKDGKVIIDGAVGAELAYSNWIHSLETSGTTLAVEFAESGNVMEALGGGVNYKYTFTGAGTLEQYFSAIELIRK